MSDSELDFPRCRAHNARGCEECEQEQLRREAEEVIEERLHHAWEWRELENDGLVSVGDSAEAVLAELESKRRHPATVASVINDAVNRREFGGFEPHRFERKPHKSVWAGCALCGGMHHPVWVVTSVAERNPEDDSGEPFGSLNELQVFVNDHQAATYALQLVDNEVHDVPDDEVEVTRRQRACHGVELDGLHAITWTVTNPLTICTITVEPKVVR